MLSTCLLRLTILRALALLPPPRDLAAEDLTSGQWT